MDPEMTILRKGVVSAPLAGASCSVGGPTGRDHRNLGLSAGVADVPAQLAKPAHPVLPGRRRFRTGAALNRTAARAFARPVFQGGAAKRHGVPLPPRSSHADAGLAPALLLWLPDTIGHAPLADSVDASADRDALLLDASVAVLASMPS
jgi:hypothetical protein